MFQIAHAVSCRHLRSPGCSCAICLHAPAAVVPVEFPGSSRMLAGESPGDSCNLHRTNDCRVRYAGRDTLRLIATTTGHCRWPSHGTASDPTDTKLPQGQTSAICFRVARRDNLSRHCSQSGIRCLYPKGSDIYQPHRVFTLRTEPSRGRVALFVAQ